MASLSAAASLLFLCMGVLLSMQFASSESTPLCPGDSSPFLHSLQSQCPSSISPIRPLQVDGYFIDRFLMSKQNNGYAAVLFYASWCPFSMSIWPTFEALSSMFPQVDHLAVEQSATTPSVFSKYGIHSLPTLLMVNQTSRMRYHVPKTLNHLVEFYVTNTGLQPVQTVMVDQSVSLQTSEHSIMQLKDVLSVKKIIKEPYLALSVLFTFLRLLLAIIPRVMSRLKAFWVSYVPHMNLEIFREATQLLGRVVQVVDVRRIWTKVRLSKARNFHVRAKSARAWASSLASVSLGESSSARSSSS